MYFNYTNHSLEIQSLYILQYSYRNVLDLYRISSAMKLRLKNQQLVIIYILQRSIYGGEKKRAK